MKHVACTVTEWAKGLRPSLMVTVEPDRDGRTASATLATKFLVWVFPALIITDWIPGLPAGYAAAVAAFLVMSRAIYVGPAVAAEPEPADQPA